MSTVLLTEDDEIILADGGDGTVGASSLNDTVTQTISKEPFTTNPNTRGWLLGPGWSYDAGSQRLQFTP